MFKLFRNVNSVVIEDVPGTKVSINKVLEDTDEIDTGIGDKVSGIKNLKDIIPSNLLQETNDSNETVSKSISMTYVKTEQFEPADYTSSPVLLISNMISPSLQLSSGTSGESNEIHCGTLTLKLSNRTNTYIFIPYQIFDNEEDINMNTLQPNDIVQHKGEMHKIQSNPNSNLQTNFNIYHSILWKYEQLYSKRDIVYYNGTLWACLLDLPETHLWLTKAPPNIYSRIWHDMSEPFFFKNSVIGSDLFENRNDYNTFINKVDRKKLIDDKNGNKIWNNDTFGEINHGTGDVHIHMRSLNGSHSSTTSTAFGDPFIVPLFE